ncbi:MAG: polysaccharide biosynthesis protein [Lactobacillaceae bacterium]|jgi:PST family polysaccharide transporter|nr:polysaccharide biosynthesis protein [Lactobacillaceae bacterium]
MKKSNSMMAGAGILALTGIIAKILSALYRIPLQNMVGNTGFYVYQQVYPIYGIGMVFALSGWPLFVSKVVSEQPDEEHAKFVVRRIGWLLVIISLIIFGALFFGASGLAVIMGGNVQLQPVIQSVSWMFLLMPILTITRGYSQGQLNMLPTSISQIVEQVVRVAIIVFFAAWAVEHNWSIYQMGTWTMAGAPIAAVVASILLLKQYRSIMTGDLGLIAKEQRPEFAWRHLLRRLLNEGGIVAMLAAMLVFFQLMDSVSLKNLLVAGGMGNALAEATKGVYDRGQPLVQLGMVVATSIGTALLPNLRGYVITKKFKDFKRDFSISVRISSVLAVSLTGGMIAVMPQLNQMLFGSRQGDLALMIYALAIIPATMIMVLAAALQSLDRTKGLMTIIFASMLLKFGLNWLLVPAFGIVGASWATIIGLLPIFGFVIYKIPRVFWQNLGLGVLELKVAGITLLMMASAFVAGHFGDFIFGVSRGASSLTLVGAIIVGAIVFVALLHVTKLLNQDEWAVFPKGDRLYQLLNEKRK